MAAISPARKAAFQVLMAVARGQSHSDDLLRGNAVNVLSAPDRNLATALVLGVLRWQISLDAQIQPLLKRPNAKLDKEILIALRMGAFQLQLLDRIPARAAIDESVELAKQAGHKFASGMVNAVLRKLAEHRSQTPSPETTATELARAQAHPAWLVERWISFYGLETARAICRHGQNQPQPTARIVDVEVEEQLVQAGVLLGEGELLSNARTVVSGDITSTSAFTHGRIRLQDEGSQLVAEIAASAGTSVAAKILDCCAAPGGKTMILAERNPEALIVACEASKQRFTQMRERLAGCGDRIECRLADATALEEVGVFDLALADVPCTGTGTLGRNPEIRHHLKPEDLPIQAERQKAILAAALRAVRVGGRVVYSTCSLEPEENEQVIAGVLAADVNARLVAIDSHLEAMAEKGVLHASASQRLQSCITPEGALRLLPGLFNTDGFYVVLLERTA